MYAFMVQMLGTQEKHAQINEYNGNKNAIKKKKMNVLVRGHRWHQFRCLSEMGQAKCLKHETTIHFRKQNQSKEETFMNLRWGKKLFEILFS